MPTSTGDRTPIYYEHELFGVAALPVLAGTYRLTGDSEEHSHDFLEIAVVGGGAGRHVSALGTTEVRRGAVFVLRPGAWHGFAGCRDLVVANTCLSLTALGADLAFLRDDPTARELLWAGPLGAGSHGVLETRISPRDAEETVAEIGALQELLTHQPERRLLLLGHLLAILGRLVTSTDESGRGGTGSPVHPAISLATARLDAAPERPWQLDELARAVSLDPAYLTRLFRRHLGLSPITYLARLRAEKAAGLLARTTLPVARVGSLVGWPDPTYFARRFRAMVGLTPSDYRQHLRRDEWTHGVRGPAGDRGNQGDRGSRTVS